MRAGGPPRGGQAGASVAVIVAVVGTVLAAAGLAAPAVSGSGPALHTEGPPPGYTGGFGEPTCRSCHAEFDLNVGGSLRLDGLPDTFEPGATYVVSVILRSTGMEKAGFQVTARFDGADDSEGRAVGGSPAGTQAGTLESLDDRTAVVSDSMGRLHYVQHVAEGAEADDPELATWSFRWTAPHAADSVVFHAAANSANGDNSPLGDLVYTTQRRLIPEPPDAPPTP